jgi:hypothetical protein
MTRADARLRTLCGVVGAVALLWMAPAGAVGTGDCDGNGVVTIDELIKSVNIALASRPVSDCVAADENGDGEVGINELVAGVNNALNGITVSPTPSPAGGATPTVTAAPTRTGTATAVDAPTATATGPAATASATPSQTATSSPTPSLTAIASPTGPAPSPTASFSAAPTHTVTPTVSASASATGIDSVTPGTPIASATGSAPATATAGASHTPTDTGTATATHSGTPTHTGTRTASHTRTATHSATPTLSRTATPTRTGSNTPTVTLTPTHSATSSATRTRTPTRTATRTRTATATRTITNTPTNTSTASVTRTPTATRTATHTGTVTSTPTRTATQSATLAVPTPTATEGFTIIDLGSPVNQVGDPVPVCFNLLVNDVESLTIDFCVSDDVFEVAGIQCFKDTNDVECGFLDPSAVVLLPTSQFATCELDAALDPHGQTQFTAALATPGAGLPLGIVVGCKVPVRNTSVPGQYPLDLRYTASLVGGGSLSGQGGVSITVAPLGFGATVWPTRSGVDVCAMLLPVRVLGNVRPERRVLYDPVLPVNVLPLRPLRPLFRKFACPRRRTGREQDFSDVSVWACGPSRLR